MSKLMRPFSLIPVFGDWDKEFSWLNKGFEMPAIQDSNWQPKADIIEEAGQFLVKVDIPGVDPKDINIDFDNNALTIKGEKEAEHQEKKNNFIRYERSKGSFYRRIALPDNIDAEKISAKNKNGVLCITIPKAVNKATRKIQIQD